MQQSEKKFKLVSNKKTRTKWLNKLCIPKELFENDIETYANYLENKWSMPKTQNNYCQSVKDLRTGFQENDFTRQLKPRAMTVTSFSDGIIGQESLSIWTKRATDGKK